jgi:hypothetical protein
VQRHRAADVYEVWLGGRASIHLMGGAIMGQEASTSVTNSFGQTYDAQTCLWLDRACSQPVVLSS